MFRGREKLLKAKSIVLRDSRGTKKASLPASRLSPAISAPLYANSAASRSGAVRTDPINSLRHEWSHLSLSVYVSGPPGPRFDDTDIYTTYIRTHGRYYLAYLDPRTHARTHAGARIATTNALTLSRALLLRTRCQVRRGGGYLVFERYHRDHGYFSRLFGIRSVYAPSFGIQRWNSSSKHEVLELLRGFEGRRIGGWTNFTLMDQFEETLNRPWCNDRWDFPVWNGEISRIKVLWIRENN